MRKKIRNIAGAFLLGLLTQLPAAAQRPNIVFIIGDDVGCYDLGCYGNTGIQTPNIDRLAANGLYFGNAYLTTSSCSPSRVSILTGRYPHNTGAAELHSPLPANQVFFAELLRKSGYYTAQAGKWHFGSVPGKTDNDTAGLGPAVRAFDRVSVSWKENGDGGEEMWVKMLQERPKDKPFFMWFASYDSHRPWGADQFPGNKARPGGVWVPEFLWDGDATRQDLTSYYNEIMRLDHYVGEVLKELEREGVADNTLVIFTSDNGRPFPRCKTRLYDSGIKTPLLIRWPAHIHPSGHTAALVSIIDLAPTLLDVAGIKAPATFQGKSFTDLFVDPGHSFRTYVFSEHNWHDYEAWERQVRTKNYLYILNKRTQFDEWGPADAVRSPSMRELYQQWQNHQLNDKQMNIFLKPRPAEELYQVSRDPFQFRNLAGDIRFTEDLNRLRNVLKQWEDETGDDCPDHLTPDQFDRVTGDLLSPQIHRGQMPGKALGADTITLKGPFQP
jgi:arylsulfatase A-like enzyme